MTLLEGFLRTIAQLSLVQVPVKNNYVLREITRSNLIRAVVKINYFHGKSSSKIQFELPYNIIILQEITP